MRRRLIWTLFLTGLLLQLVFIARVWRAWPSYPHMMGSSVVSDIVQYQHLIQPFLEAPRCEPSWKKSGNGLDLPGCFLPFLLGAPVLVTHDLRAAVFVVLLFHLAAGLLLVRTLRPSLGDRFTAFYLVVFWLSPWRLFHSGFIWEPNLLLLPAAAHLWGCWASRDSARRLPSFVLGLACVLTPQIHPSALFLLALTALLLSRRALRLSWVYFAAGVLAGATPLIPAALSLFRGGGLSFSSAEGFLGRGFLYVQPLIRTFFFWFRLGSLSVGRMRFTSDCASCVRASIGGEPQDAFWCRLVLVVGVLAAVSVVLPIVAGWSWLRDSRKPDQGTPEAWMRSYSTNALWALLIAGGLSPITLQTWHVVIALPAACLPVAGWIDGRWPFQRRWVRALVIVFLVARLPIAGLLAFQYPAFCLLPAPVAEKVLD